MSADKDETLLTDSSLHSYHMWLKEKQLEAAETKKEKITPVKDEEEDSGEENFRVDAVLDRGPSPPESEASNSYEWSYEEQFKQLYEIDSDSQRKAFLDEYFEFMKSRTTPVSRIPIMAKQILDLYQLYNLVVKHGGLVQVIRNKQWSKITKGLNLPTSITSAAFTLRTQYLKYLYAYECTMHNFSTPKELQAAIDSNRRDRFSTFYHSEPTMTPSSRDERFPAYPMNGSDYPASQSRHMPLHPVLGSASLDMRYGLKRHSDSMMPKAYEKYIDSPKVIVLQDGTPSMADGRTGKLTPPPPFHPRPRSPLRENEMRTLVEIDAARRRSHHITSYASNKDWDGDARHMIEEETRRRMDESRNRTTTSLCKDKNCNGIDCQFPRNDFHRHRGPHDTMMSLCTCAYCKDYPARSSFSPHRQTPRHHTHGSNTHETSHVTSNTSPRGDKNTAASSSPSPIPTANKDENDSDSEITTLKIKLPDIRKGGNKIKISLEIGGVLYEGHMSTKSPLQNGKISGEKLQEPLETTVDNRI